MALLRRPRLCRARRLRPRDRGGVREHGHQEGGLRKLDTIAKPGAILATNTSYLDVDEIAAVTSAAGRRDRPALLLAGQRDAAAGGRARREDREGRDRHLDAARARRSARSPCWSASATASSATACSRQRQREAQRCSSKARCPGTSTACSTTSASPMGPFAMSDLAGLDIGWSQGDAQGRRPCATCLCETGSPRAEDRRRLLRLRREPQRQPSPVVDK